MSTITVRDSLKMIRETLCVAQGEIGRHDGGSRHDEHIARISRMTADIDRQRPLGTDGKHGRLHTSTCGCEDKPESAYTREPAIWRLSDALSTTFNIGSQPNARREAEAVIAYLAMCGLQIAPIVEENP